jgi:peptidoglycan/xylan/chitin deacetylase (PgdA/CDA1 family)
MPALKSLKRFIVDRPYLKQPIKKLRADSLGFASLLLGPDIASQTKMLGYHTVGQGQDDLSLKPEQFEEQLDWLQKNQFQIITMRQWWDRLKKGERILPRTVILTFDDGLQGTFTHAAPILAKRGLAATVFIITHFIGGRNGYDRFLNTPDLAMLSWEQVKELDRLGWDIQSHSHRHYPHYKLAGNIRRDELVISKAILEERLGKPVDFFCFPYGAYDRESSLALHDAGYKAAVTCRDGHLPENLDGNCYALRRTLVYGFMTLPNFTSTFQSGYYRLGHHWNQLRHKDSQTETPFEAIDRLKLEVTAS